MTTDVKQLVKLIAFPSEVGAAAVVAALGNAGIQSIATGDITAGFRAEAPSDVRVMVAKRNLAQAQQILSDLQKDMAEIDWSNIDVGQPEE